MMEFFRKYQRSFVLVIATMTIFSFLFFGTFSTFTDQVEVKDRVLTHAVDGSKLMQSEVEQLARFIATDRQDIPSNRNTPNFCNDGVIRFDLLQTGLADVIVSAYFDPLREGLQQRIERIKRYRSYAHPEAPFLSAAAVWDRFVPELSKAISDMQNEAEGSAKSFHKLFHLYELQSRFPAEWLRRVLLHQHRQYSWLKSDPHLQQDDLSVFGFHSSADWFGQDFIDLCAQFILNAARSAERKGYQVSIEEAKADLINQFTFTAQKIQEANPGEKFDLNFHTHLRSFGFDEKTAAAAWRNVLLFRRYFQGVGQSAFIDRLPYTDFASYALESAVIQLYQWPRGLRVRNFSEMIQVQFYIDAVAQTKDLLAIPVELRSIEEIEQTHPELVQTKYGAKISKATKGEVGLRASVKQVWEWQISNWEALRSKFPSLPTATSRDEKFKALESLALAQRTPIDNYARKALVEAHPDWIENAFGTGVDKEIRISKTETSLSNIEKVAEFQAALEVAEATQMPFRYSDDEETYYQISEVEKKEEKHLLACEDARQQGILSRLVQNSLEKEYPQIRSQHAKLFKSEDGKWKSLVEVKDLVAKYVYADLLTAIDKTEPKDGWAIGDGPLDSYPGRRFLSQARTAMLHLKNDAADPRWLGKQNDPLIDQFKLSRKEHTIQRIEKEEWMMEEALAFTMVPNQWSSIHTAPDGEIAFFYFQEKKPHHAPILEQLVLGKETIAADAQRFLAERLIGETKRKPSIVIPIRGESQ